MKHDMLRWLLDWYKFQNQVRLLIIALKTHLISFQHIYTQHFSTVLKLVNHPNIIRMEGLYESKQYLYIVMEMLTGGELFERIVGRPRYGISPILEEMYMLVERTAGSVLEPHCSAVFPLFSLFFFPISCCLGYS